MLPNESHGVFILTLAVAVCFLFPSTAKAQLGGERENESEEDEVKVPLDFRIGVSAGRSRVDFGTSALDDGLERVDFVSNTRPRLTSHEVNTEAGGLHLGAVFAVDPKAWPVSFTGSIDFMDTEIKTNYNSSLDVMTEFGISEGFTIPYIGVGLSYFKYKRMVSMNFEGEIEGESFEATHNEYLTSEGFGLNFSGGVRFPFGFFSPFLQADMNIGDSVNSYSIKGGLSFNF